MEQFIISCGNDIISVSSCMQGLAKFTKRLISPPFDIEEGRCAHPVWEIELKIMDDKGRNYWNEHMKNDPARLVMSTDEEYVIGDYSEEMIQLYQLRSPTGGSIAIESDLKNRKWTMYTELANEGSLRWFSRMVRLYFGSLLRSRGHRFFHASSVSIGGKGVLFAGGAGCGKSSLMYLACSRLGVSFLSDDLVVLCADNNKQLQVLGWPKRIALGLSLLKNEVIFDKIKKANLRRGGLGRLLPLETRSDEWSRSSRVAFDQDEFLKLFGFSSVPISIPALIIFAEASKDISGWNIERLEDDKAYDLLEKDFVSGIELKYVTDYLGLANRRPKEQDKSHIEKLMSLPRVKVTFDHSVSERFSEFWKEDPNVSKTYR